MKRRLIALVLVISLVASLSVTAFAGNAEDKKDLIYVSIGDSMTNGYGIDGYSGDNGILNYGINTYPNQFAAWLAGYEGQIKDDQVIFEGTKRTVDHRALAMSGMRSEDLNWLLRLNYTDNDFTQKVYDSWNGGSKATSAFSGGWYYWEEGRETPPFRRVWYDKDKWAFEAGDYRTWRDLVSNGQRLHAGAAEIIHTYYDNSNTAADPKAYGVFQSQYVTDDVKTEVLNNKANPDFHLKNVAAIRVGADYYQNSVKDADLITLALGNTNFGTYMFQEMKDEISGSYGEYSRFKVRYHLDDVYLASELPEEIETMVKDMMKGDIGSLIKEYINEETFGDKADELQYIMEYCIVSYILNYIGTMERILELNPDATIIQIALMNAYASTTTGELEGMEMGEMIDVLYGPLNMFLSMVPSYLQQDGAYPDATFYFADCGIVETLTDFFGSDYYYVDANENGVRDYGEVTGEYPGMELSDDLLPNADSTVRDRFRVWIAGNYKGLYKSKQYYTPGSLSDDDGFYGEVWKNVLDELAVNDNATGDFFGLYDLMYVTDQDLIDFVKLTNEQINAKLTGNDQKEKDWVFSVAMYMAWEDAIIRAGKQSFTVEQLQGFSAVSANTFAGAFKLFYDEHDVTSLKGTIEIASWDDLVSVLQSLSDALVKDPASSLFLCLANRMEVGTGIGGHPSEGGHYTMYEAIKNAYETGYTAADATEKNLLAFLNSKYPNLMGKLNGSQEDMDDLDLIIEMLKMSDSEALEGIDLDELEEEIRDTLRAYEKAHTAEELEEAQAAADTLYLILFDLAAAVTGTEYEPTENSFYVSLGDSNVNGYGLPGYDENTNFGLGQIVDGAAPVELAKELYDEDWENRFYQYAQGALRSEDMLSILTGKVVNEDSYWKTEVSDRLLVPGDIEATNKAYIEALQKADLISVAVGGGNITTFVGRQVDLVLAGNEPIPMDWAVIGYEDEALVELDEMLDTMVPLMDAMGMMDQYLPEGVTLEKCGAAKFGRTLLESVLYGYASYNYYYPMVLDTLRAINPEAQLLILGMFNPVDDWNTTFGDKFINIGGITDNLMESANLQNLAFALQTPNTTFVDLSDNITFLDEDVAAGKKKPTFEVYYESILEGNGKEVHASANGHAYMYEQMLAALSGEGYDEELKDLGQLVYEALCDDYLTTREKLNILGEAYATAKHEGVLKQNREIAVAEEIYEYLDDAGYIGDDQILEIIKYVLGCALDGEISKMDLADYIIEVLGENEDLTDADRVAMIGNIYTILEDAGYLADYEADLSLLEDLHAELKDYLTDTQSVAIVEAIYDALTDDGEMSDEEKIAIAQFVYELVLVDGKLSYEKRVDAIVGVYGVLKTKGYLAGYEKELAMVEELVAHEAMEKVTAEQAFAIVDYIYNAVCDGDVDTREMIGYIYFDVLSVNPAVEVISLLGEVDSNLTAADKLAIVEAVYEVLKDHNYLEFVPNLEDIEELYDVLTDDEGGEQLVSDELALSIIDLAVEALVENETLGEEEITEVAAEIADKLLAEDSELSHEAKAAVLREVTNALKSTDLGETEIGGVVIPALDVIDELRTELEAYLSDEQVGEIVEIVYSFVKENDTLSEKQKAQLADEIYTIVLNREDLTAEDKIEILTIIYTVLDEHDYVDANVAIAYMKAYAAAKEKGYIDDAALALDAVKGIVELAKDYVDMYPGSEELKALLLEELDNTEETLDALIGLLDNEVLDEAAWAELKALKDELNKHIETITELAEAMGVELDDCIADLEDAAKVYGNMIAEVAEAAYDYAVESIEGFADDYAEWVESVGDEIDEVNPVLGDAVRKFLTEVPADSLSILYAYGDEAVAKLVSEAVKAYGDMEVVIADLAYVLNTYGEEIYEAVKGNDEIETLIEDIQDQLAEVKELVEWINDHPFEGAYNASVADKEAALQTAYDQLMYLYNRLYDVTMSVVADVDEDAAEALEAALDALKEILCIAGESAEGYLGWLAEHGEAMGCALLTALLDNIEELLTTACPIVDELIWALLAQVDQAVLEFLPVADQWMYDWLYNNPDKVIAFFTEYGEEIGELAEEYGEYVVGILGYIAYTYGPEVLEYVIENPEEALEQFVAWYDKYGYRVWPMIDVYLEELGVYDAIEDGAEAVIEKIEEALEELGVQIESEIRDLIEEKLDDATHGEYTVTADSYYVAIDEMYAEGEEGYADKLAEHLGIAYNEINELDEDEIAKADLITVRYNNEPMIGVMIEDAKDYKTVEAKDWSVYVGEVGAEYVQQALAEVKAMLAEQDLGTMGDMALVAVESYAYEYVGHMISYIQDLETISEINPDALVISVGMNNALADVVLTLDEEEIALGEYIQYVVDAANLEAFVYVLVTGNAIYVDAPAVETEFDAEESADVMDFILNLIDEESREVLLANDAGHEYIKEQILGALTITYEGLLGDANSDGVVDYVDAIYVLEYDAKLRTADELAYSLCDVNGDGAVDYVDAIFILEYDAKLITKFPAAV